MGLLALFKAGVALSLDEAMAQHRARLLRAERHTMRRMERAWRVAEAAVSMDLEALLLVIATAESAELVIGMGWLEQQARYTELLATIGREIDRYATFVARETTDGQKRAIVRAVNEGHREEKAALREAKVRGYLARLDPDVMGHVVGTMSDGSPLRDLFQTIGPAAVRKARTVFEEEIPKGTGSLKIGKRLEAELEITRRRSETIARTEVNRCYRSTRLESLRKRPDLWEGWMWQSALDKRTCPICWGMHGKVFGLVENWPGSHPVCRCAMRPLAKGRPRKAEPTGDEVFAQLPEKDQKAILLTPGRFDAFKAGTPLSEMVLDTKHPRWGGGKALVPIRDIKRIQRSEGLSEGFGPSMENGPLRKVATTKKIEEIEAEIKDLPFERLVIRTTSGETFVKDGDLTGVVMNGLRIETVKGAVVTHNHPGGSDLSFDDLFQAANWDMQELRAVRPDGSVDRVVRPAKGWKEGVAEQAYRLGTDEFEKVMATEKAKTRNPSEAQGYKMRLKATQAASKRARKYFNREMGR